MYQTLIFYHSIMRWVVLLALVISVARAARGYMAGAAFSKNDNLVRHWTATIAHVQLMIGIVLYFKSPVIRYFFGNFKEAVQNFDTMFFGMIHSTLMLSAIVIVTIGSAVARRKAGDADKHYTILVWYLLALFIIFCAIPWPFSPLANRPYLR